MLLRKHGCDQLVLIVTEDCNLRCRYCVYSGQYQGYRQYSHAKMSFETAKAAIDYYYQLSQRIYLPDKLVFVNFYGGEPLLRLNFIKRCIAYARSLEDENTPFSFGITTNGTLLTEELADYFIAQEVNLVFSLDGPKEEHDRNRVYPNGRGSFDQVMQALEMIRAKDPTFYREHVMTNTVYDADTDLLAVNDFFVERKDEFPPGGIVSPQRHDPGRREPDNSSRRIDQEIELLRRYRHAKIGRAKHDTFFLERLAIGVRLVADRDYGRVDGLIDHFTGRCLPGTKIAVRPDGTFHICERINECFPIGDCKTGLNFERIRDTITLYDNQVTQHCHSCVAQRFCSVCFAQACTEDGFDATPICGTLPELVKAQLSYLCSILEENPRAFDELRARPHVVEVFSGCP